MATVRSAGPGQCRGSTASPTDELSRGGARERATSAHWPPWAPGPPPWNRAQVILVLARELLTERRFLIPVHERPDSRGEQQRVGHEQPPPEHCRLSENPRSDGEIHRVPHVPVEPADDELLGRRSRRRGANALDDKPSERIEQDSCSSGHPDPSKRLQPGRRTGRAPPRQQPRHQPRDHPRSYGKKRAGFRSLLADVSYRALWL